MRFACRVVTAKMKTYAMVDKAYCIIIYKFRLIFYSDKGKAYKSEKLGNDLSVIMICIPELYIWIKSWWSEYYIVSLQRQRFYIKTHVGFIVAGDINFPYKHWFATLNIFVYLTVKCSLTTHTKFIVIFHCKNG